MDYAPAGEDRPLAPYAVLTGAFGALFAGSLIAVGRRGLPDRYDNRDLVLLGLATHKVSRLLAKDKVTSFLRAPFTRYQEPGGHGEVEEAPRGTGMQLAIGELLVCPYCLAQWVAAGFLAGHGLAPRATRYYAVETAADVLRSPTRRRRSGLRCRAAAVLAR